jgi:hypothetical protein
MPRVRPAKKTFIGARGRTSSQGRAPCSLIAWLGASRILPDSRLFLCSARKEPVSPSRPKHSAAVRAQPRSRPARMRRPRGPGLEVCEHGREDGCGYRASPSRRCRSPHRVMILFAVSKSRRNMAVEAGDAWSRARSPRSGAASQGRAFTEPRPGGTSAAERPLRPARRSQKALAVTASPQ